MSFRSNPHPSHHTWGAVAAITLIIALAGCATVQQNVGGWFGETTPTPSSSAAVTPRVYYAGVEDLKVFSEPSASARVLGQLQLHDKVMRHKVERGYAYVDAGGGKLQGWVDNAQLIWRLPNTAGSAAPAPAGTGAEPEEPAAPAAEAPPAPTATEEIVAAPPATPTPTRKPAAVKATPRGPAPSIFDAY